MHEQVQELRDYKKESFLEVNSQQQSSRVSSAPQKLEAEQQKKLSPTLKFLSALLLVTATKKDLKHSVLFFSNIVTSCNALHLSWTTKPDLSILFPWT